MPDGAIHRCRGCGHAFTELRSLRAYESYGPSYFEETHRNWMEHPNLALFRWIDGRLPRGTGLVVELGCGRGDFLRYLRRHRSDLELIGVDQSAIDPEPGIVFRQADVMAFSPDRTPDAVVALAVIEHLADPVAFARRMAHLVQQRPEARIVVMTLNDGGLVYRLARLAAKLGIPLARDRLYSSHHLQHFTTGSLRACLEAAGLRVMETHFHNAPVRAIDIPVLHRVLAAALRAAVAVVFAVSGIGGGTFLQTVIARPSTEAE